VVGLEIKHELVVGQLQRWQTAALPAVARLWSRAIDPQGVVVAMAPLQAEGATARATLAVGAGFDLAGTFVEITGKPTLAPASAALRGLRRAHEHAHVALRAERLSHFEPAAASWRLSAGSWAELDDVADQAAALHFAARDLGLAGLTTDADALAARARQLGRQEAALPEPEEPFLAEALQALAQA
jgi:hypothetical protein